MITREDEANIDFGLHVVFDGKTYKLMMPNLKNKYPVGGLICEYTRLAPTDLKNLILSCGGLDKPVTVNSFVKTFMELQEKLTNNQLPVVGTMVAVEFMNTAKDWFDAVRTDRIKELKNTIDSDNNKRIKEFIFENTGYTEVGGETVLQLLLTCYFSFATTYVITKAMFTQIMESAEVKDAAHDRSIELVASMYQDFMDAQHIDYRIILSENGFESLYTLKTSISLLLFELAHCIKAGTRISKCKNCGHYFVPKGRSNAVYCAYPLQDNKGKSCKDVGAKVTRAKKEKNDIATKEYRRAYMRCIMAMKRHPEDSAVAEKFTKLTEEVKSWREKLDSEQATTEDFLKWLSGF